MYVLFLTRNTSDSVEKSVIKVKGTKFIDTGGGFLLEEKEGEENEKVIPWSNVCKLNCEL